MQSTMYFPATAALLLIIAAPMAPAFADNQPIPTCDPKTSTTSCIGSSCSTVGETTMELDQKDILACLNSDTLPSPQWKSQYKSTGFPINKTASGQCTARTDANGNPYITGYNCGYGKVTGYGTAGSCWYPYFQEHQTSHLITAIDYEPQAFYLAISECTAAPQGVSWTQHSVLGHVDGSYQEHSYGGFIPWQ